MKKLLISSLAVLALATSSLTLAQTYNSNGTATMNGTKPDVSTETKKTKGLEVTGERVRVIITGTNKNHKPINATEVTVNREKVEGKALVLREGSPIVKVAEHRCESTNAADLVGKTIKEIKIDVKDGICKSATFVAAK